MKKSMIALLSALALMLVPMSVYAGAPLPDTDGDGVPDEWDNCISVANPNQTDGDFDGYGNVCDPSVTQTAVTAFGDVFATLAVVGAPFGPTTAWFFITDTPGAAVAFGDVFAVLGFVGAAMGTPPLDSGLACASATALPQPVVPPCTGV